MNPNDYPHDVINPPDQSDDNLQYPSSAIITPRERDDTQPLAPEPVYQPPQPTVLPSQSNIPLATPKASKHRSKWPLIFGLIALLLVVAGVGVGALLLMRTDQPTEKTPSSAARQTPPAHAEVVADLQKAIAASDVLQSTAPLGYKVRGFDYYTAIDPAGALNLSVQRPDIEATRQAEALDSTLRDKGFNAKPVADDKASNSRLVNYFSDQVFCSRSVDTSPHFASKAVGETIVGISCAEVAIIESTATQQQPFYDSFVAADQARAGFDKFVFGAPQISQSKTVGYQTARLPYAEASAAMQLGSQQALFYKTPNDKAWQFLAATDKLLNCSVYGAKPAIKKAFLGEQCIDSQAKTVSSVKL